MMREIAFVDVQGKTLKHIECSYNNGQAVIIFDDETFITLGIEKVYEDSCSYIQFEPLDMFDFGDELLQEAGVVTQEELEKLRQKIRQKQLEVHKKIQEIKDLQEYERLKKRFEIKDE